MNVQKPERIESGIPGIQLCPECGNATCFVLPDFSSEMQIIGYSCPACKTKKSEASNEGKSELKEKGSHKWIYDELDFRKCAHCLMQEFYDSDNGWQWHASEEFMDSKRACKSESEE